MVCQFLNLLSAGGGVLAGQVGLARCLTFLKLLKALECDFEAVLVGELSRVVHDINPEKGDDRHLGGWVLACGSNKSKRAALARLRFVRSWPVKEVRR